MNHDFPWVSHYYGELAALSAAFLWSVASVLYSRIGQYLSPLKMNLLKNIIAMVMAMMVLLGGGGLFAGLHIRLAPQSGLCFPRIWGAGHRQFLIPT